MKEFKEILRINYPTSMHAFLLMAAGLLACDKEKAIVDYSGTYCLNIQNMEMYIVHTGNAVTFTLQNDLLVNGEGTVSGDTLILSAYTTDAGLFSGQLIFSGEGQRFSGPYQIINAEGKITSEGILMGNKGSCIKYDINASGIPKFIQKDFTQLAKIERISKFRSGFGHSYTDGTEECRSMKHYYTPLSEFRENNNIEIYSPVTGIIVSVSDDGFGASVGLNNKMLQIQSEVQPAFVCVIFHCDLASPAVATGKKVLAGELLGHGRLFYEDLEMTATSFDIAVWASTPSGMQLVSYFDALTDDLFNQYKLRGATSRQDFIITKDARDADPLDCNGDSMLTSGSLENWVTLN